MRTEISRLFLLVNIAFMNTNDTENGAQASHWLATACSRCKPVASEPVGQWATDQHHRPSQASDLHCTCVPAPNRRGH